MDGRMSLEEFNAEFKRLSTICEINESDLSAYFAVKRFFLPAFYPNRYMDYHSFDVEKMQRTKNYKPIDVPIKNIYGDGWLFSDQFKNGRPLPERMSRLITMTPLSNYPSIFGTGLTNDRVHVTDGNHRIFAAYLLGWETIRIVVDNVYYGDVIPEDVDC